MSVELESCSRLLDNFFSRVHIKNPVLDEKEIRQWAREISFNGIGWDGHSCLVVSSPPTHLKTEANPRKLLVCALGSISETFPSEGPNQVPQSFKESEDYQLAEAWFAASQKRIGTLLSCCGGILEAQCFFFSAVYLMHTFRPFSAWPLFLQAIACCQMFQCFSESDEEFPFTTRASLNDGTGWRSEESMYWTCFKSELYVTHLTVTQSIVSLITLLVDREIRFELSLPAFNAANLTYPEFLPSPPLESIQNQDQAWYFYLAEIALRRLANQILSAVLPHSYTDSICDLRSIAARMPDFESQADQWYLH
jgi:hypothetical protein